MRNKNLLSTFIASIFIASCSSFLGKEENDNKSNNQGGGIYYNNSQDSADAKNTQTEEIQEKIEDKVCSVTFFNENKQLDSTKAKLGEQPIYKGPIPGDKTDEIGKNVITYRFVGWSQDPYASPEEAIRTSDLPVVTDDTVYFAIFNSGEKNDVDRVSVSFYNENKYIYSESVVKGQAPKYKSVVPKKDSVKSVKGFIRIYKFEGWHTSKYASPKSAIKTKDLPVAYESTTYYAIFSYNDYVDGYPSVFYMVTFMNYTTELSKERYLENTNPTYYGTVPTASPVIIDTARKHFTFVGWSTDRNARASQAISSDELPVVTENTTYYAIYSMSETPLAKYTVTFKDEDDEILYENKDAYEGYRPSYVGEKPIKVGSKFVGWHNNPEAKPSQAIKEEDLPVVTEDTVYYAIYNSDFFILDKSEIELDVGGERKYTKINWSGTPSISGELVPVFDDSSRITCEYSSVNNYSLDDLTVLWTLEDKKDSRYFSVENIEGTKPGISEVSIKAIRQSRVTKLKATLVNKNDTKTILRTAYCEVRSVTIDIYHLSEYSYCKDNIAGEVGSNFGPGYTVSLYRGFGSHDEAISEDVVFPTKVNIDGKIKPVRNIYGSRGGGYFGRARNFYIPNTVFVISNGAIDVSISSSIVFSAKPNSILLIHRGNFDCYYKGSFAYQYLNKTAKIVFPYNKYALSITDKDETHAEFKYPTFTRSQMDAYHSTTTLFKKV